MLQRIQSIFMFLAVLSGILIFFFPIATYLSDSGYLVFFIHNIKDLSADPFNEMTSPSATFERWFTLPLSIGQLLIIILGFFTIFRFRKRTLQIRLNSLNIFLNVLLVGGIFYYTYMLENFSGVNSKYDVAVVFPLLTIILLFVANHYIRKDEKLIRSADRLR